MACIGIAALSATAGFWLGRRPTDAASQQVAALTARVDDLERRITLAGPAAAVSAGRQSSAGAASGAVGEPTSRPRRTPAQPLSAEENAARRRARKIELDAGFAAEPLDADWAASTQSRLLQATLSEIAIQSGVAPASFDARCRSRSCRIVARFEEGADGSGWADHYILGATDMLSTAETLVEVLPDGSTEVSIYGSGD